MTLSPCLNCGEPTTGPRCPEHTTDNRRDHRADTKTYRWTQLSQRARRLQPFCLLCGTTKQLQADHSPRAWARMAARLPLRLHDITVLCGPCNSRAGSSKPGSDRYTHWQAADGDLRACDPDTTLNSPRGGDPSQSPSRPASKAKFVSHTGTLS